MKSTSPQRDLLRHIQYHSDSGHAWLRVPHELLKGFNLKISPCSYKNQYYAYLEEDVDAFLFLEKVELRSCIQEIKENYDGDESFIRHLPPYNT